jgi:hypothetical protein
MLARSANNLGNVAYYRERDQEALSFYRLAEARFDRVALAYGVAETVINTGIVWRDMELLTDTLTAARRAFDLATRIDAGRLVAQALVMRGETLALLGDRALGLAQVQRGLGMARMLEDRIAEVDALRALCLLERETDPESAERYGLEAVAVAEGINQPWARAEAERDLGMFYRFAGRDADARRRFAAAAGAFRAVGAETRAERLEANAGEDSTQGGNA